MIQNSPKFKLKLLMKKAFIVMVFGIMLLCTGCGSGTVKNSDDKGSSNDVTERIMNEKEEEDRIKKEENKGKDVYNITLLDLPELWYNFGVVAQRWFPVVWIASWVIALILWDVGQNIMDVKKVAIKLFLIKIPVAAFLVTVLYVNLYALVCF